jgi:hypothetical protein
MQLFVQMLERDCNSGFQKRNPTRCVAGPPETGRLTGNDPGTIGNATLVTEGDVGHRMTRRTLPQQLGTSHQFVYSQDEKRSYIPQPIAQLLRYPSTLAPNAR